MKKSILFYFLILTICISCREKKKFTYEEGMVDFRIRLDGAKDKEVKVKYIGNSEYSTLFCTDYSNSNYCISSWKIPSMILSIYQFKDINLEASNRFEKNEDIYEVENTTNDILYVWVLLEYKDKEKNKPQVYDTPYFPKHYTQALLRAYDIEDRDPNYVAGESLKTNKGDVKYIPRIEFYETLIEHKFPYIYKLQPKEKCTVRWGLVK